jgi:hypothetical protein
MVWFRQIVQMIVMLLVGLVGFHICDRLDLSEE